MLHGLNVVAVVSILTCPRGRVLRLSQLVCRCLSGFNPHPPSQAGATRNSIGPPASSKSFNPHPLLRTGATHRHLPVCPLRRVSIPTRPRGRVLRPLETDSRDHRRVSILTCPYGRVQPTYPHADRTVQGVSILTRLYRRVLPASNSRIAARSSFQSSPAQRVLKLNLDSYSLRHVLLQRGCNVIVTEIPCRIVLCFSLHFLK